MFGILVCFFQAYMCCTINSGSDFAARICNNQRRINIVGPFTVSKSQWPVVLTTSNAKITVSGKITFEHDDNFKFSSTNQYIFTISGNQIDFVGSGGAIFDGSGYLYYDRAGEQKRNKPKFFHILTTNSVFTNFQVKDSPIHTFWIDGHHNKFSRIYVNNKIAMELKVKGQNTDGFVVFGDYVSITNSRVENNDDCIAVKDGKGSFIENIKCYGGRGIDVGSIRQGRHVSDMFVKNCEIYNNHYGIQIKAFYNETGSVKNVTYKDIFVDKISRYAIILVQDYKNSFDGAGSFDSRTIFQDILIQNVTGTADVVEYQKLQNGFARNIRLREIRVRDV